MLATQTANIKSMSETELRLFRYRALCKFRALHEEIVLNLDKIHGAVLTGLGNEAAPAGIMLGMIESMDAETFLFSPKCGDQRSQMVIGAATDYVIESEHDHSYELLSNHLQRKGVEDANVHWGCLEHGIWPFFTSDMMRPVSLIAGGAWEVRRYLDKSIGVYMFGEGAASQGAAHEVMTWLSAQNCARTPEEMKQYDNMLLSERARRTGVLRPAGVILGMQINNWSIYTNTLDEHGGRSKFLPQYGQGSITHGKSRFAQWAESYGLRGVDVNGDNLEQVINATKEAIFFAQGDAPVSTMLMLHMDMRRTGHNEHQIRRSPEALKNREWWKASILNNGDASYISEAAMERAWQTDPLRLYSEYLIDIGIAAKRQLDSVLDEERGAMGERFERAMREPPATFEGSVERRGRKYFMFAPHEWELSHRERPLEEMLSGGVTTDRALLQVIGEFMEEDEGVTYQGEDVGSGGVLIRTRTLQKKFGPERVFDTPIVEEAILGTTAGASITRWILRKHGVVNTLGTKICEMQFMTFDGDGHVIMRSLAPNYYQKEMPTSFIDIEHYGVVHSGGSGHYHSDSRELEYLNMPGIAVVCPSDAFDLVGLMRAARECQWPVVFMSPIWSYGEQECAAKIPREKYLIPLGKAAVKRPGKDITVLTYGTCVRAALREAEFLANDGIDVEVVDLRSLAPLDMETISESVKKTGRVVVMTEASPPMAKWLIGEVMSNPELRDAISRTRKPILEKGESVDSFQIRVKQWIQDTLSSLYSKFSKHDLDTYNRAPRIQPLSRDWSPIASAKDIEWQDLPFEEYIEEVPKERGEIIIRKHVRSVRLSLIAHDLMRY